MSMFFQYAKWFQLNRVSEALYHSLMCFISKQYSQKDHKLDKMCHQKKKKGRILKDLVGKSDKFFQHICKDRHFKVYSHSTVNIVRFYGLEIYFGLSENSTCGFCRVEKSMTRVR
jgi:hypothetical protein